MSDDFQFSLIAVSLFSAVLGKELALLDMLTPAAIMLVIAIACVKAVR